jgi:hypothetical protein
VFTASQSKNQPLRERERRRRRRNERRKEKKEDSRRKHCVYISLLPLVLDIPLSLTIKQQYQISSLATFLGNQVSISFYSYKIIYINIILLMKISVKSIDCTFSICLSSYCFFFLIQVHVYMLKYRSMMYLILLFSCSNHSRLKPIILHLFTRRCRQTNMSCIR